MKKVCWHSPRQDSVEATLICVHSISGYVSGFESPQGYVNHGYCKVLFMSETLGKVHFVSSIISCCFPVRSDRQGCSQPKTVLRTSQPCLHRSIIWTRPRPETSRSSEGSYSWTWKYDRHRGQYSVQQAEKSILGKERQTMGDDHMR